ncbi:hypothetical protein F7725_020266, partial [Dissostichus mawsoni]
MDCANYLFMSAFYYKHVCVFTPPFCFLSKRNRRGGWLYLAAPPHCTLTEEGLPGDLGPVAELFLPIRTLCTKALKQPPLWHDDN